MLSAQEETVWGAAAGGGPPHIPVDPNGNLSRKTENGSTWSYGWDAENRLVRVCKDVDPDPCTNANALARFAYDPLGRRVEKLAAGVTYRYLYDGQDILRETRSDGTVFKYIHGPGIDEPLAREDAAGNLAYYYADGLGSIVKMTDAAGAVIASHSYDAWGNPEGPVPELYGFTGREHDVETGLIYYRARYYDPKLGRFISEDPIGFGGGVNFYGYAGANPLRFRDPRGEDVQDFLGGFAMGGATTGAVASVLVAVGVATAGTAAAPVVAAITAGIVIGSLVATGIETVALATDPNTTEAQWHEFFGELTGSAIVGAGGARLAGELGWNVTFDKYKTGGGGMNVTENGARRLAIDVNEFKNKQGKTVCRPHGHWGKTKSQMRKHRNLVTGKPM